MMQFWASEGFSYRSFLLVLALLLDVFLGDPKLILRILPHPVALFGKLINFCEHKLNHNDHANVDRLVRGALMTIVLTIFAILIGWALKLFFEFYNLWLLELFIVALFVAQRSLYDHVQLVSKALENRGIEAGREAVAHIVGRNTSKLDMGGISRASIESLSENFADGIVAPVFWYLIFGLPGILFCKAVNTLDSMIGYRNERYNFFGRVAARLDDVVMWIPARIAALLIIFSACLLPKCHPVLAFRQTIKCASRHSSINAGWPEAAMAGALRIALGGPRSYKGGLKEDAWIGTGRTDVLPVDIKKSLNLFICACCVNYFLIALFCLSIF